MPNAFIALGAALFGLCTWLLPLPAAAWCRTTTKTPLTGNQCVTQGLPLRWERPCISFSVEDPGAGFPDLEAIRDAADRSFGSWTDIACDGEPIGLAVRQTEELARCSHEQYSADAPNMNSILFIEDWNERTGDMELPSDAFAVTLVWNLKTTGEIVDADMLLNPTLGNLTICGSECRDRLNDIDLQNVMTHEAGHFLGLAHSDIDDATMSSTAPVGETIKRDLTEDDEAGLCSIYGDLPAADCPSKQFVPRHGFSPYCAEPMLQGSSCSVALGTRRAASGELFALALALGAAGRRLRRRPC